ncbi:MAG: glycosyltransferase family 2 protein, partial [Pirellula sp.]
MQKISILVPADNDESTIGPIVDKLVALPFSNCEIIVVDDGSKDNTVAVVREYASKSPRIRLFLSTVNAGKTA